MTTTQRKRVPPADGPDVYAAACVQEARMEALAQQRRRDELTAALIRSVRALVEFDSKSRREMDRLLVEADGYLAQKQTA